MTIRLTIGFLVCVLMSQVGCGPSSRTYSPVSEWEERAFSRADREIYPDDVRQDFAAHDSSRIAWPGIVLEADREYNDSTMIIHFTVEHHYYDWIEDFSIQKERIFLSPRGEGNFRTDWYLNPEADTSIVSESIGNMIIVYGIPTGLVDSVIDVRAYYVRVIDKPWFATDIFEYGRPGEPMKILRVPQ